jgi:hypothetical protein
MEQIPGTNSIIYPQEIWQGYSHRRADGALLEEEAGGHILAIPPA